MKNRARSADGCLWLDGAAFGEGVTSDAFGGYLDVFDVAVLLRHGAALAQDRREYAGGGRMCATSRCARASGGFLRAVCG